MKRIVSIEEVRAREADPQHDIDARQRIERLRDKLAPHNAEMNRLANAAMREKTPKGTIKLLRQLADIVDEGMKGIAPCASGCDHCCHIPVLINQAEADMIAEETGAPISKVKYTQKANMRYTGQPCPFLQDGSCGIYASRPFPCRIQYSLDADNLLCHLFEGETISVPYFDNRQYYMLSAQALGIKDSFKIADIREFFPKGKG